MTYPTQGDNMDTINSVDNTALVFLVNEQVRAIRAEYEVDATPELFKTLDPQIKVGDYVVVVTHGRHGMTVVKVVEVDVDPDLSAERNIRWVVGRVDVEPFEKIRDMEAMAIAALRKAKMKRDRKALQAALLEGNENEIRSLPIACIDQDKETSTVTD